MFFPLLPTISACESFLQYNLTFKTSFISGCFSFAFCISSFPVLYNCFLIGNQVSIYEHENDESRKLMWILQKFREADPSYYQPCHLVRQGEQPREGFFILVNLVEDHVGGMNGYLDWILQIHRQTQQNA